MSSSISNSDGLPTEDGDPVIRGSWLERELYVARRVAILCALLAPGILPLAFKYAKYAVFLSPPVIADDWHQMLQSRPALVFSAGFAIVPIIWLISLEVQRRRTTQTVLPWAAVLAVAMTVGAGMLLEVPKIRWLVVEWCKIRTPNPSFARNTLFWEQRTFESAGPAGGRPHIGLVGSSQVYMGVVAPQLADDVPGSFVEKNCLAGFGPMQYPMLIDRIDERGADAVVGMISGFDMFRDDDLPVNRLRWSANPMGVKRVLSTVPNEELWRSRGAIADLGFASFCPPWRWREHIQRTILEYWWNVAKPPAPTESDGAPVLAASRDVEGAKESLRRNVRRTRFVDTNFACFRIFADHLAGKHVALVVLEGQMHPDVRDAFPEEFDVETRRRMTDMAASAGFLYVPRDDLPTLTADDFADGYHLNESGRKRMTAALAGILQRRFPSPSRL